MTCEPAMTAIRIVKVSLSLKASQGSLRRAYMFEKRAIAEKRCFLFVGDSGLQLNKSKGSATCEPQLCGAEQISNTST